MASKPEIRIVDTPAMLFQAAASEFIAAAASAIATRGRFSVALAGGSTPKGLYTLLASAGSAIPWDKIFFFFGDERHVPPDNPESNYRMAREAMLSRVPEENVFRIHAEEKDAGTAALLYEQTLREFFQLSPGQFPRFDLILLGTGPDGHSASLFPGTTALNEKSRLVVANWVEKFNAWRITLTFPVINNAANVTFLVSGAEKAPILKKILETDEDFPCKHVQPSNGKLVWLIDRPAASELSNPQTQKTA